MDNVSAKKPTTRSLLSRKSTRKTKTHLKSESLIYKANFKSVTTTNLTKLARKELARRLMFLTRLSSQIPQRFSNQDLTVGLQIIKRNVA